MATMYIGTVGCLPLGSRRTRGQSQRVQHPGPIGKCLIWLLSKIQCSVFSQIPCQYRLVQFSDMMVQTVQITCTMVPTHVGAVQSGTDHLHYGTDTHRCGTEWYRSLALWYGHTSVRYTVVQTTCTTVPTHVDVVQTVPSTPLAVQMVPSKLPAVQTVLSRPPTVQSRPPAVQTVQTLDTTVRIGTDAKLFGIYRVWTCMRTVCTGIIGTGGTSAKPILQMRCQAAEAAGPGDG
jgi:hypothetical protein